MGAGHCTWASDGQHSSRQVQPLSCMHGRAAGVTLSHTPRRQNTAQSLSCCPGRRAIHAPHTAERWRRGRLAVHSGCAQLPPRTRPPRPGRPRCPLQLPTQSNLESMDSGVSPSGMPSASSHGPPWPLNCSSARGDRLMSSATVGRQLQGLQQGEHGNGSMAILPEARVSSTLHSS